MAIRDHAKTATTDDESKRSCYTALTMSMYLRARLRVRSRKRPSVVIEPLDKVVLRRRTVEVFPAGYLTVLSIIQGVALGITVTQAVSVQSLPGPVAEDVTVIMRATMTLLAIIIVSYEYVWFTVMMRWRQTFADSLIPFVLGTAEIVVALHIGRASAWWLSSAVLVGVGILAFSYTKSRLSVELFANHETPFRITSGLLRRVIAMCGGIMVVATVAGLVSIAGYEAIATNVGAPLLAATCAGIVWVSEDALLKIYAYYDEASDFEAAPTGPGSTSDSVIKDRANE